jgi:DNA-directed RNA polymerase specialized sigma24 family protein
MLMIAFGPLTVTLLATLSALLGFAVVPRKSAQDGEDYYQEHMVKRLRQPVRYALEHPVETIRRLFRS